jgi:hypothetical protein
MERAIIMYLLSGLLTVSVAGIVLSIIKEVLKEMSEK